MLENCTCKRVATDNLQLLSNLLILPWKPKKFPD